ncbi:hypothetical protein RvY_00173 [Ramazzottius varieornatus]|uniref:rRNA adenine N(6)-methyltransferase n=1 Tax=Ramazzottius varieornatus TaxID=947166 RepID=A0A1D1UFZ2_RAMVA|nr:hypothetical protein RvY_00173 [Ramazzottius varieornatus]
MLKTFIQSVTRQSGRFIKLGSPPLAVCPRCGSQSLSASTKSAAPKKSKAKSPGQIAAARKKKEAEYKVEIDSRISELDFPLGDYNLQISGRNPYLTTSGAPKKLFTSTRNFPGEMYIGNHEFANRVASLMSFSPSKPPLIVEGNPGMGLLTYAMLEKGAKKIRAFEGRAIFVYRLQAMQKHYGYDRLELVCPYNVFDYFKKSTKKLDLQIIAAMAKAEESAPTDASADSPDFSPSTAPNKVGFSLEERLDLMLNPSKGEPQEWSDPVPALKFVGVVPQRCESVFLRRLLDNVAKRKGFCSLGRAEFFLLVSPRTYTMLTTQPGPKTNLQVFRWMSIAAQTFFDITALDTAPRSSLLPPVPKSKVEEASTQWTLVRLTAKPDLPDLIDWTLLPEFIFFLKQAMTARLKPVVQWLEGWIPGYGKKYLDQGNNMYIRTGDLTAHQWTELFRDIVTSGDYASSNLKIAFGTSGQSLDVLDADEDELEDDKIVSSMG